MPLDFDPPLLNSATPWATTKGDLWSLYHCKYTAAMTIRTCLTEGYPHDESVHQYCLIDAEQTTVEHSAQRYEATMAAAGPGAISSLNTLGYSPIPMHDYIKIVKEIISENDASLPKPIIFSVVGSISDIKWNYSRLSALKRNTGHRILMEINLSCPNIAQKPPPAYSETELMAYLLALATESNALRDEALRDYASPPELEVGIKTPPYTYRDQFISLTSTLQAVKPCPISFITATNTLGSCLLLNEISMPVLKSEAQTGIGGLGGSALHPLALGNVRTIRSLLDEHEELRHISIIGVGGVSDEAGFRRMRAVGAEAIGVGTGIGNEGLAVFKKIWTSGAKMNKKAAMFSCGDANGKKSTYSSGKQASENAVDVGKKRKNEDHGPGIAATETCDRSGHIIP